MPASCRGKHPIERRRPEQGVERLDDVKEVRMESEGHFSVITRDAGKLPGRGAS